MKNILKLNNMINKFYAVVIMAALFLNISCSLEDNLSEESIDPNSELVEKFRLKYPEVYSNSTIKELKTETIVLGKSSNETKIATIQEVLQNNEIIGYLTEQDGFMAFSILEKSNEEKIILMSDLSSDSQFSFKFVYDEMYGHEIIQLEENLQGKQSMDNCDVAFTASVAACVLGTVGIAASDGPLPAMDIIAASFYITCNGAAVANYDVCKESKIDNAE